MSDDRCDLLCLDLPLAESLRQRLDRHAAEHAAERAKALSDPTRLLAAMVMRDGGELCVCDLSWVLDRSENLVSHHARMLRQAGLAQSRREGKMVLYSLTALGRTLLDAHLRSAVAAS
jgi:DNA-binding transcriptional ArsR family regulator